MGYSGGDPLNDGLVRKCKVFVCARAVETNSTSRLRSYDLPHEPYIGEPPTITQAAMATSAAVSFFDPIHIGNRKYLDAGLGTNNPVDEVEEEACEIWCRKRRLGELQTRATCFVSIGTGHPGNQPIKDRVDKFLMKTLREIATETETTARKSENKWAQQMENKTYFRFNVDHGLDEVGLEEYTKEGTIESVTDAYLKTRRVQMDLDNCTQALVSKQFGSGKTFIATTVVEEISASQFVGHFFFQSSDCDRMTALALFRALIPQMIAYLDALKLECASNIQTSLTRYFGPKARPPTLDEVFKKCFLRLHSFMIAHRIPVLYLIDGLHECEGDEINQVLQRFQELVSYGDAKVFITSREVPHVTDFITYTITVVIAAEDTQEDIRKLIDWKMSSQQHRVLQNNDKLARSVKRALNNRAHLMFLWVMLQLESICRCKTEDEVHTALHDLPPDLDSLYAARFSKVTSAIGIQALRWIYCVPRSFKIAELCEFLAIDPDLGNLQQERVVDESVILEDCFNLVYVNINDEVVLVHHSFRRFLQSGSSSSSSKSPKWNWEDEQSKLARLCLKYMTGPDFVLTMQHRSEKMTISYDGRSFVEQVFGMPRILQTKFNWRPHTISISQQDFGVFRKDSFKTLHALSFARDNWLPLTRHITTSAAHWAMFLELALAPSERFRFHPWECQAQSMQAHYSKVLGWSIAHSHWPLLQALFQARSPKPVKEIYDVPLPDYRNLLPLHLAARIQKNATATFVKYDEVIFENILSRAKQQKDDRQYTMLHHAAETGNDWVPRLVAPHTRNLRDIEAMDDHNRTPLATAALSGRHEMLRILLSFGAAYDKTYWAEDSSEKLERPLMGAAKNGHLLAVQILLAAHAEPNANDSRQMTALHYAAGNLTNQSGKIIEHLLQSGADHLREDFCDRTAIEIACVKGNVSAVEQLMSPLRTVERVIPEFIHRAVKARHETVVRTFIEAGGFYSFSHSLLSQLDAVRRTDLQSYICFLRDCGVDFNATDAQNQTPLMLALRSSCLRLAKALISLEGSNLRSQDNDGDTALHFAATSSPDLTQLLIDKDSTGLDVHNLSGLTPLSHILISLKAEDVLTAGQWRTKLTSEQFTNAIDSLKNFQVPRSTGLNLLGPRIADFIRRVVENLQFFSRIIRIPPQHIMFKIDKGGASEEIYMVRQTFRSMEIKPQSESSTYQKCCYRRYGVQTTLASFGFDTGTFRNAKLRICLIAKED
ncbi:hypothetical protein E8E13_002871 [Curvularia kusanoi]|uniref:Nephrocystin 3-like N-terminal domain-containing protein n=1 Tax=Curvularia kusanoi TaxID=90978 RepID=A0A9P4T9K2_CURKU|nr:hypothetical protein E8E13_002871 [Curvularia kusanoi]